MIELALLRVRTLADLHSLGRTPEAPPWIKEVEDFFVYGEGAKAALLKKSAALLVYDAGAPVGVALLKPHSDFLGAAHLQAFLLGHEHRGRKLAKPALRSVLAAPEATDRGRVVWLVHPSNDAMQAVSLAESHDVFRGGGDDGYDFFIFDR